MVFLTLPPSALLWVVFLPLLASLLASVPWARFSFTSAFGRRSNRGRVWSSQSGSSPTSPLGVGGLE
eukprot:4623286-Pyramimonas_sp.AAC.1